MFPSTKEVIGKMKQKRINDEDMILAYIKGKTQESTFILCIAILTAILTSPVLLFMLPGSLIFYAVFIGIGCIFWNRGKRYKEAGREYCDELGIERVI